MSDNDDVTECVVVRGVTIDLANVSHSLRRQFHAASAAAGKGAAAKAKLNEVGEAILAEQMPTLAFKYAPKIRGIDQLHKRAR